MLTLVGSPLQWLVVHMLDFQVRGYAYTGTSKAAFKAASNRPQSLIQQVARFACDANSSEFLCNLSRALITPAVLLKQHAFRRKAPTPRVSASSGWVGVNDKPPKITKAFLVTTIGNGGDIYCIVVPLPTM